MLKFEFEFRPKSDTFLKQYLILGPVNEDDVKKFVNDAENIAEEAFDEAEDFFSTVLGKTCVQKSDCSAISYCGGKV